MWELILTTQRCRQGYLIDNNMYSDPEERAKKVYYKYIRKLRSIGSKDLSTKIKLSLIEIYTAEIEASYKNV